MRSVALPASWRGRALVLEWSDDSIDGSIGDSISDSIEGGLAAWFSDDELATVHAFPRPRRREEWLLSRYALKRLAVARGLSDDPRRLAVTRPQLAGGQWISISHSHGFAAAAIDDVPIGVDVERLRVIDEHVARHFMIDTEIVAMERCTLPHRVLHWWCAKEAAWKRQGGEIRFLKQVPLKLEEEAAAGLRFQGVETSATAECVVALTL
jgi:phosphopantetheinyl transferase